MVILWLVLGILSTYAGIKLLGVAFSYIDYGASRLKKKCPRKKQVYVLPEPEDEEE